MKRGPPPPLGQRQRLRPVPIPQEPAAAAAAAAAAGGAVSAGAGGAAASAHRGRGGRLELCNKRICEENLRLDKRNAELCDRIGKLEKELERAKHRAETNFAISEELANRVLELEAELGLPRRMGAPDEAIVSALTNL